jgi:dTDP-4-dehydrorhamnose 3,5-epimerase
MHSLTPLPGMQIYEPKIYSDVRGFFVETYNQKVFSEIGITNQWLQDNTSSSKKNVLRGLHFQKPPYEQAKLVSVTKGSAFDVAVDLRKGSKTFGHWFGIELNESNHKCVYIPRGFGHGFLSLTEETRFCYKVDNYYHPESDSGIHFNDPQIAVAWPVKTDQLILSPKDQALGSLADYIKESSCKHP